MRDSTPSSFRHSSWLWVCVAEWSKNMSQLSKTLRQMGHKKVLSDEELGVSCIPWPDITQVSFKLTPSIRLCLWSSPFIESAVPLLISMKNRKTSWGWRMWWKKLLTRRAIRPGYHWILAAPERGCCRTRSSYKENRYLEIVTRYPIETYTSVSMSKAVGDISSQRGSEDGLAAEGSSISSLSSLEAIRLRFVALQNIRRVEYNFNIDYHS